MLFARETAQNPFVAAEQFDAAVDFDLDRCDFSLETAFFGRAGGALVAPQTKSVEVASVQAPLLCDHFGTLELAPAHARVPYLHLGAVGQAGVGFRAGLGARTDRYA